MKKCLYMLSGLPACGKSTWAQNFLNSNKIETTNWHSRDKIRFDLLGDNDNYFAYEDEVYDLFVSSIQDSLNSSFITNIIVDQTNLNDGARNKLLSYLKLSPEVEIINVVFDVPIEVCKARNARRTGRARVPDSVVENMAKSFRMPKRHKTIVINERGDEKI